MNIIRNLKINKWWVYKIGTGVFSLILFKELLISKTDFNFSLVDFYLFGLLISLAINGHFINDYSDYDSDKIANKNNIFNDNSIRFAPYFCIFISITSIVFSFFFFSNVVFGLVVLQVLGSVLYSIKPFRIKERGVWSMFTTGIYERLNPYLIILFCVINEFNNLNIELLLFVIFYLAWSYFWECRNFINGQLGDLENDQRSNIKSLAIVLGKNRTNKLKKRVQMIEFIFLLSWLIMLVIIEFNYIYFPLCVISLQLIQVYGARQLYSKIEVVLDNCYSNIFMASLLITLMILNKVDFITALIVILLFQFRIIVDLVDFTYYRFRYLVTVGSYIIKKRLMKK